MAETPINFNNYASWDLPVWLNRLNPIPTDKTTIWYSKSEAEAYAQNVNLAYIGQTLSVIEGENVVVYKINADRTLTALATSDNVKASGAMVWAVQLVDESGQTYWSEYDEDGNPVTKDTEGAKEVLKLTVGDSVSYVANLVDLTEYLTKAEAATTYVKNTTLYGDNGVFIIDGDDVSNE